jgi:hypothetical protein
MGHEGRREPGQPAMFASLNTNRQQSRFSFIAPAFAATGFDAIILRSSLTRLRMTPRISRQGRVMQMRPTPPPIYIGATISGKEIERG